MFKSFKQWMEERNGVPETDDEAKIRLPQDVRAQAAYDQMRKTGQKPGKAWNNIIQAQWRQKKAMGGC